MMEMGDMGDMFTTNVNKVSKEEIQVNVYGLKSRPHLPHLPQAFPVRGSFLITSHEGNARRVKILGCGLTT